MMILICSKRKPNPNLFKTRIHYDGFIKVDILLNLTHKKTFLKNDVTSFDIILGDNFRYDLNYYIENGFNISFGFRSRLNQFNRNVTKSISHSSFNIPNVNLINVDFFDLNQSGLFSNHFCSKILDGWRFGI